MSVPDPNRWGGRGTIDEMVEKTAYRPSRRRHWWTESRLRMFRPQRPDRSRELWELWLDAYDGDPNAALGAILESVLDSGLVDLDRDRWHR